MKKTLYQNKGQEKLWAWSIRSDGQYLITSSGFVGDSRTAIRELFPTSKHEVLMKQRIAGKLTKGFHQTKTKANRSAIVQPNFSFDSGPLVHQATRKIAHRKLQDNFQDYAIFLAHNLRQDTVVVGDSIRMFRGDNGKELDSRRIDYFKSELKKLPKGTIITGVIGTGSDTFLLTDTLVWNHEDCSQIAFRDRYKHVYRWVTRYNRRGRYVGAAQSLGAQYLSHELIVYKLDAPTEIRMKGRPYSGGIFKHGPTN